MVCCWIQPSVISVVYGAFATWLLVLRPSSPQLLRCCSAAGHQQDPVLHDEGSAETTVSFPRLIPTGTLVAVGAMVGRTVVRVHWGSGAPRWLVDYLGLDDRTLQSQELRAGFLNEWPEAHTEAEETKGNQSCENTLCDGAAPGHGQASHSTVCRRGRRGRRRHRRHRSDQRGFARTLPGRPSPSPPATKPQPSRL